MNDRDFSSTEKLVASVWLDVLAVTEVALDDTFVGLGGDSIAGIRCAHRLRVEHGIRTRLSALLDEKMTLRRYATLVESLMPNADT